MLSHYPRRCLSRVGVWYGVFVLSVLLSTPLTGQDRVVLEVSLTADSTSDGSRSPVVLVRNLLADDRWSDLLQSGIPVRLEFQVELWRARDVWFDAFERQVGWDVLVLREPLLDQYTVTTISPGGAGERRYATIEALARALGYAYQIAIRPSRPGRYYYTSTLGIGTLSDADLEALERFLQGDLGTAASGNQSLGDAVSRGAKRLLLRLAGVPSVRLEGRSVRFSVR